MFFYKVTTWLGERKAIAIAAIEHHHREPGHGLNDVMVKDLGAIDAATDEENVCLLYTSPSPRDLSTSRMPSSA